MREQDAKVHPVVTAMKLETDQEIMALLSQIISVLLQVRIQGGTLGARPPLDPRFWGPKIEHFWALFNFSIIFFCLTSLGIIFI